jgi:hypothetical protein
VFKDQNAYLPSAWSVIALGAGAGAALCGAMAALNGGLALETPLSASLSALFVCGQLYLTGYAVLACLHAVSPAPFTRPAPPGMALPSVDVVIAFDDPQDTEAAAFSLASAARLRYPADKLRIHLVAAGAAAKAGEPLVQLARTYGASWMPMSLASTRGRAMAYAFERLAGQLTLFLKPGDAPAADLLDRIAPMFSAQPTLGLVACGHFLLDADGARAGTANARRLPADPGPVARALLRGGVAPCPSMDMAALWRRGALVSSGGLPPADAEGELRARLTAVSRGWESRLHGVPMIARFAPSTTGQAAQIMAAERFGALDTLLAAGFEPLARNHWHQAFRTLTLLAGLFAPFALILVLAAPPLAALLGARLQGGEPAAFALYGPAAAFAVLGLMASTLSGWRHSAAALFLEVAANLALAGPHWALLRGRASSPRGPAVALTVMLAALGLAGAGYGGAAAAADPRLFPTLAPLAVLSLMTAILALGALGAVREPRQKRAAPRLPACMDAALVVGHVRIDGRLADISVQGARFVANAHTVPEGAAVGGLIRLVGPHGPISLPVQLSRAETAGGETSFGLKFTGRQLIAFANAIALVYRTQERFAAMRDARGQAPLSPVTAAGALLNGVAALLTFGRKPVRA